MSKEQATLANEIAAATVKFADAMGAEAVIVMIGLPDGGHSAYCVRFAGPCLQVRGLLETGAEDVRRKLIYPDQKTP